MGSRARGVCASGGMLTCLGSLMLVPRYVTVRCLSSDMVSLPDHFVLENFGIIKASFC